MFRGGESAVGGLSISPLLPPNCRLITIELGFLLLCEQLHLYGFWLRSTLWIPCQVRPFAGIIFKLIELDSVFCVAPLRKIGEQKHSPLWPNARNQLGFFLSNE
ncbi:hypothetical protein K239x_17240 [Planctomycetes bacterium K23_9]|uniref:Uncharacterized protein n=1 Tax=Stieleria marina TaxID=1930275 RepID=A0A517NRM3_9BACT|nr:hypothetical protein K239x_17240 [Planctomycetes bacterium K23_9]